MEVDSARPFDQTHLLDPATRPLLNSQNSRNPNLDTFAPNHHLQLHLIASERAPPRTFPVHCCFDRPSTDRRLAKLTSLPPFVSSPPPRPQTPQNLHHYYSPCATRPHAPLARRRPGPDAVRPSASPVERQPARPSSHPSPSPAVVVVQTGKHIESALSGVAEGDRCAGWKTGKCPGPQPKTTTEIGQ